MFMSFSLDFHRYGGRYLVPTQEEEEDMSLFNRDTYNQPYHDNIGAYESWNHIQNG